MQAIQGEEQEQKTCRWYQRHIGESKIAYFPFAEPPITTSHEAHTKPEEASIARTIF